MAKGTNSVSPSSPVQRTRLQFDPLRALYVTDLLTTRLGDTARPSHPNYLLRTWWAPITASKWNQSGDLAELPLLFRNDFRPYHCRPLFQGNYCCPGAKEVQFPVFRQKIANDFHTGWLIFGAAVLADDEHGSGLAEIIGGRRRDTRNLTDSAGLSNDSKIPCLHRLDINFV